MGAAALPLVAMGLEVGGKVFAGNEERKAYNRQAKADEENARLTELQASVDATGIVQDEGLAAGEMVAGFAESGFAVGSGSAFDLVMQSAFNREKDIAAIRRGAATEAGNFRASAKNNRRAGRNALIGSLFSAAGSAIKGASGMASAGDAADIAARERNAMLGGSIRLQRRAGSAIGRGASAYRAAGGY